MKKWVLKIFILTRISWINGVWWFGTGAMIKLLNCCDMLFEKQFYKLKRLENIPALPFLKPLLPNNLKTK
jgi:hypothetical protein